MSFQCSICLSCTPDIEGYSSVKCGHVFHTTCILTWLPTGKACPECRVPSSKGTVTRLYLKTYDGSSQLDTSVSDQDINWVERCHAKELRCQEMQRELEEFRRVAEERTAEAVATKETVKRLEESVAKGQKYLKDNNEAHSNVRCEFQRVRSELVETKSEMKRMRDKNQQLEWLSASLSGSIEDVDAVLSEAMNSGESASVRQNLAACITVLKRELESSLKKYQSLRDQMDAWSTKETRLVSEVDKRGKLINALTDEKKDWEEERNRLIRKMSAMKKMLEATPGLPQTQIKRFIAESPAPLELLGSPGQVTLTLGPSDYHTDSVAPVPKRQRLPESMLFESPEAITKKTPSAGAGLFNFGKKAGAGHLPNKPKLTKSIFGGTTPSPSLLKPSADAENATPWARSNVTKKLTKKKNAFDLNFDADDGDILCLN